MLEHGTIPPHLHLDELSPVIPWASLPIDVPDRDDAVARRPAPPGRRELVRVLGHQRPRRAGSAAGGGRRSPPPGRRRRGARAVGPVGRRPRRARAAARPSTWPTTTWRWPTCAPRVNTGRDAFAHREVVVAGSIGRAARRAPRPRPRRRRPRRSSPRPRRPPPGPPGRSGCSPGRARSTPAWAASSHAAEPVVAEVLDRCDAFLRERFDLPLLDVMWSPDDPRIHQTGVHAAGAVLPGGGAGRAVALVGRAAGGGASATASASTPPPTSPGCSTSRTG